MRDDLSDDRDSLGCTYTTPHDISRPSVIFFRNGRWRSLTKVMGKSASAKSQMALIAVHDSTSWGVSTLEVSYSHLRNPISERFDDRCNGQDC